MSLGELLANLLVPALLIAVNPVPIIVAVTLLMADHGRRSAAIFAATLALVMALVGGLTVFFLGAAESSSQTSASNASAVLQTAFGVVFLTLAVLQWRAKPSGEGKPPGWMKLMDKAGFGVAVVLGVSLTNYALLTVAATNILKSESSTTTQVAGLAFFIVVAVSTVVCPLVVYLVRPEWATRQLCRLKDWLTAHDRVVITLVFALMGVLFAALGLTHLL